MPPAGRHTILFLSAASRPLRQRLEVHVRQYDTREVLLATLLLLGPTWAVAQDRAAEVLAQARVALGAASSSAVTSLAVKATVRRVVATMNMEISSDLQLEYLKPGRYRRTEAINIGAVAREVTMGLRGDQFFYEDGGMGAAMGVDPRAPRVPCVFRPSRGCGTTSLAS